MKPKEAAERLGVSVRTLQRWDKDGVFPAYRTPTNRRFYTEEQIRNYLGESIPKRKIIAYARVSNRGQNDDLDNQLDFIKHYTNANGIIVDEYISDIGSGLNYKRPKWNKLIEEVMESKVDTIYITYKDRFIRFGYEWFESLCHKFHTKIVVLNNKASSPEEELVEDLVSIIHVFSSRIYGLRKYKKKIEGDEDVPRV